MVADSSSCEISLPVARGAPLSKNIARAERSPRKRSAAAARSPVSPPSTKLPKRAKRAAGPISCHHSSRPYLCDSMKSPRTLPGTIAMPRPAPPPGVAGRKSSNCVSSLKESCTRQAPPPPSPAAAGSTTARTIAAATAASAAVPSSAKISRAAKAARASTTEMRPSDPTP